MIKFAFDIGGVVSKHIGFMELVRELDKAPWAEVYFVTDMPWKKAQELLHDNEIPYYAERILSGDYETHGEGCKQVIMESLGIDFFFDDFVGYVAAGGAKINMLVFPDKTKPYYHDQWKIPGAKTNFGRQRFSEVKGIQHEFKSTQDKSSS